jgi:hypothetical protein
VEAKLKTAVCAGTITLSSARSAIKTTGPRPCKSPESADPANRRGLRATRAGRPGSKGRVRFVRPAMLRAGEAGTGVCPAVHVSGRPGVSCCSALSGDGRDEVDHAQRASMAYWFKQKPLIM